MSYPWSSTSKNISISLKTKDYIDLVLKAYMLTTEHKKQVDKLVTEVVSHLGMRKDCITKLQNDIEIKKTELASTRYEITVLSREPSFLKSLFTKSEEINKKLDKLKIKEATLSKEIDQIKHTLRVTGATKETTLFTHVAHIQSALDNLEEKQKDLSYIQKGKYIQVTLNTVKFLTMLSSKEILDPWLDKVTLNSKETIDNIFLKLSGN